MFVEQRSCSSWRLRCRWPNSHNSSNSSNSTDRAGAEADPLPPDRHSRMGRHTRPMPRSTRVHDQCLANRRVPRFIRVQDRCLVSRRMPRSVREGDRCPVGRLLPATGHITGAALTTRREATVSITVVVIMTVSVAGLGLGQRVTVIADSMPAGFCRRSS